MRLKTTPLMKGAMIAVRDCMGVKKEEKVVVITDTGKIDIAKSFLFALHALGVDATLSLDVYKRQLEKIYHYRHTGGYW